MRVAFYVRTSTSDGRQNPDTQILALREFAERMTDWDLTHTYMDLDSGARPAPELPRLRDLMRDAAQKKFDIVLVWKLDRFSRRGIGGTFELINRLKQHGVEFWSATEEHFRTSGHLGELMLAIFAWMAEQERRAISERIKAGLERARKQGALFGRPRKIFDVEAVKAMRARGLPLPSIAKELRVSVMTLKRRLRRAAA